LDPLTEQLREALKRLDRPRVEGLIQDAAKCRPPMEVVEALIVPALEKLGEEWNSGCVALSQIYMSGRICEEIIERILPPVAQERRWQPPHALVVLGDYHMLGKRIVQSVMRASGYGVLDYGRMDVPELVDRVIADKVEILLISVLMLPSALKIRSLRQALDARGHRVRILVGGAPFLFDPELWREVGADAMGRSAADAVTIVGRWMEEMRS
jgi:methanogenic corrinoid protein MtbC1